MKSLLLKSEEKESSQGSLSTGFLALISHAFESFRNRFRTLNLNKMGYIPRWCVLAVDILLVCFTGFLTYFFLRSMGAHYFHPAYPISAIGLFFFFNLLFFRVFEIYSGIIRHSSYADAVRIFAAQVLSMGGLILVDYFFFLEFKQGLYLREGLIINTIFTSTGLFSYRIFVKYVFEHQRNKQLSPRVIPTLIVGTNPNAIALAEALRCEIPLKYRVLGFIDHSNQNAGKRILNLPIFNLNGEFHELMKSTHASAVIIADHDLNEDQKNLIIDECLAFDYKVMTVSLVSSLGDKKEVSNQIKNYKIEDLLERSPIKLDNKVIQEQVQGKTIMVTGAAGSIGSEIVRQLAAYNPLCILLVDQAETPLHSLQLELEKTTTNAHLVPLMADIRNKQVMERIFAQYLPELVYHAAAYKHVPMMEMNPEQAIFTNVMGSRNLADLSIQYQVEKFVMVSTDKAVNPSSVMGASKRIAEKYVQSIAQKLKAQGNHSTRFITTRFGNVLGSNGSVVPLFTRQIENGGPVTITHPDIIRYFMTIPEACQLVLEAGAMGNGGEIFIFDMGKPVKIIDLARKMIRLAGLIPDVDIEIKVTGLRPGEKLYEELLNDTSKTLPTHHEKIMIAEDVCENFDEVSHSINELIQIARSHDGQKIVSKMKALVPEYKSLNSHFESLDNGKAKANKFQMVA